MDNRNPADDLIPDALDDPIELEEEEENVQVLGAGVMEVNGSSSDSGSVNPPDSDTPSDEMDAIDLGDIDNRLEVNMAFADALLQRDDGNMDDVNYNIPQEEHIDLADLIPEGGIILGNANFHQVPEENADIPYGNPAPEDIFVDVAAQNEQLGENVEEAEELAEADLPAQDPRLQLQNLPEIIIRKIGSYLNFRERKIMRTMGRVFRYNMISPRDMLKIESVEELTGYKSGHRKLRLNLCKLSVHAHGYWEWACDGRMVSSLIFLTCNNEVMADVMKRRLLIRLFEHFKNVDSIFLSANEQTCRVLGSVFPHERPFPEINGVKDITFQRCHKMYNFLVKFPNVQYLTLGEWSGTNDQKTYEHIANNLQLKGIDFGLSGEYGPMLEGCPSFENLTAAGFHTVRPINSMLLSLPKLVALDFECHVSYPGINHEEVLDIIARTMTNLRSLRMCVHQNKKIGFDAVISKLNSMKTLTQFIAGVPANRYIIHGMTDIYRHAFNLTLPFLEDLEVPANWNKDIITQLFRACPNLKNLYQLNGSHSRFVRNVYVSQRVGRPCYVMSIVSVGNVFNIYPPRKNAFTWKP